MEIQSTQEGWDCFQRLGVTLVSPDVQTCPAAHYLTILDPFGNAIDILQML
ncbi:hypothetical protein VIBNISFn118_530026 [Vibrio nigripulchritudo SFn118]|nr:hypothetical protein VIBNISFn118_530026 [Vibrio nigripulchritudo SFn118]